MKARWLRWWFLGFVLLVLLAAIQACSPASTPSVQMPTASVAAGENTQSPAAAEPTATSAAAGPTQPSARATATPGAAPAIEERVVEMEWPEHLRMGDSDVIRLALVPVKDGYVARAEFPEHTIQTKEVPVPQPNGYTLYALARLDGVGFAIDPTGEQERFVPEGEEVAWRWTLTPRTAGRQRFSVQLRLRWEPEAGVSGGARESLVYHKALEVQVTSFLGMSPAQAATTGWVGLLLGGGLLLVVLIGRGRSAATAVPLAAGGENVFECAQPNLNLAIDLPRGITLADPENGLLRSLFRTYQRVVVENEFLSGYSGARTFLVRPLRVDGGTDALTIVKLGPRDSIQREFDNYEAFVKDRLPPVTARIQRAPVVTPLVGDGKKGGQAVVYQRAAMQYTFIAEPGHTPVSLRNALLADPNPDLLLRLFETFGPNWWMQRRPYTFRLAQEYDSLLPPHYVLKPLDGLCARDLGAAIGETQDPAALKLAPGDLVFVQAFRQMEARADGRSLSLTGSAANGRAPLRLRWLSLTPPFGGVARVVAGRMDLLREWAASFDPSGLPDGLPDPLACLPDLLEETVAGTRSVIHGDLNLENVLVGPGNLVWLIDFAQTREGHPLYDFAHLESELIAHILAPQAGTAPAYLDLWRAGGGSLIEALHTIVGRCLFDPARPREYDVALYLACLGALKYPNLSTHAKHCLYLTAGELVSRVRL